MSNHSTNRPSPLRNFEDVNAEYNKVCAIRGDAEYKISILKEQIADLFKQQLRLVQENLDIQERDKKRAEREAKVKTAPEPEVVESTDAKA